MGTVSAIKLYKNYIFEILGKVFLFYTLGQQLKHVNVQINSHCTLKQLKSQMMSPYFCWSLLSFSLKTAGMKSESRKSSAMMAFPLDTIRRMAWPHRLFSAKKSTIMAERQKVKKSSCTFQSSVVLFQQMSQLTKRRGKGDRQREQGL